MDLNFNNCPNYMPLGGRVYQHYRELFPKVSKLYLRTLLSNYNLQRTGKTDENIKPHHAGAIFKIQMVRSSTGKNTSSFNE